MVEFIHSLTGSKMLVAEDRVEEYKAAGHKLAAKNSKANKKKKESVENEDSEESVEDLDSEEEEPVETESSEEEEPAKE